MIVRGTTPYQSFILPLLKEQIEVVYVTYTQNGNKIIERSKEEVELTNLLDLVDDESELTEEEKSYCQLLVHLTQEETLGFTFYPAAEKNICVIQIRLLDTDQESYASEPIRERIFGVTKEGVIPSE